MLAPSTMRMACLKVNTLVLTNTMVMMKTAEEESSKVVTTMPTSKLLKVLEVNFVIHNTLTNSKITVFRNHFAPDGGQQLRPKQLVNSSVTFFSVKVEIYLAKN